MKLRQIVIDKTELTLTKEKRQLIYGEVFEVEEERGKQILSATFKGQPVAEELKEKSLTATKIVNDKPIKKITKRMTNNK